MPKSENFKSDSPTIAEFFLKIEKGQQFVIPQYQRKYSWEKEQCEKLFNDLKTYIDEDRSNELYFFGTIIIASSEEDNKLNLIDGQQRTTTFLLLLKALQLKLKDTIKNISDPLFERVKYELTKKYEKILAILFNADDADLYQIQDNWSYVNKLEPILINQSINEPYPDDLKKIINGETFDIIDKNKTTILKKRKENKFTNFFRNFKYFYDEVNRLSESGLNRFADRFLDKCQIIQIKSTVLEQAITMFNSLNSTGMPLTDADIISAQLYYKANKKDEFESKWRTLNNSIVDNAKDIIDINSVLQQYMYIYRAKKEPENYSSMPALRTFYTSDKQHSELLDESSNLCGELDKIVQTWLQVLDKPLVKLLLKFNENIKLFFISFLNRFDPEEIDEEKFLVVSKCLIKLFAIYELIEAPYSDQRFKIFLFKENSKLVDKNFAVEGISLDFKKHIAQYWKKEDLRNSLLYYDSTNPVLVFLNEYLYAVEKGKEKVFNFKNDVNVEHIMPNSGKDLESIRMDANIDSREEFNSYVNKLGNRILLEENINKSLGRNWFKYKKDSSISNKSGYQNSEYLIAQALVDYKNDVWTKEDIDKATEKAADRILNFIFNE